MGIVDPGLPSLRGLHGNLYKPSTTIKVCFYFFYEIKMKYSLLFITRRKLKFCYMRVQSSIHKENFNICICKRPKLYKNIYFISMSRYYNLLNTYLPSSVQKIRQSIQQHVLV